MTHAIRYQNSVLDDVLEIMTTDDLLEFAIECDWMKSQIGEENWLLVKKEFGHQMDKPWREGLRSALKLTLPGAEFECRPQQS